MSQTQLRNETYLETGRKIFKDAKEYNDAVIIASYRLIKEVIPINQIKPNCAYIFGLQSARANLNPLYDQILQLRFYMSLSYAKIAERINLTADQVGRLERKAIWQLYKFSKEFLV